MYPTPTAEQVKARLERLSFDDRMMEEGRAQILSTMITDVAEGRGDPHWQAAMRCGHMFKQLVAWSHATSTMCHVQHIPLPSHWV
ncbi:hypothetical protein HaLaN_18669, partial [Haematococcus lacustris]